MELDIIGVKGALSTERKCMASAFDHVGPACELLLPGAKFFVAETEHVQPLEVWKFSSQCDHLVREYGDSERPKLIVGHSLGGAVAVAAAGRMSKSPVGVVSIFGSFSTFGLLLPLLLGSELLIPRVPVLAFQGMRDWIVPWPLAWHPLAIQNVLLNADHLEDLENKPELALHIAHTIKEVFFPRQ